MCTPDLADRCVDDVHVVTEREWQDVLSRLKALEQQPQFSFSSGVSQSSPAFSDLIVEDGGETLDINVTQKSAFLMRFTDAKGAVMFTVRKDGSVQSSKGAKISDATRLFWEAVKDAQPYCFTSE